MKILSVGGGSGGHVTPAVAVLREIHSRHPDVEFRFWCDYHYAPQARRIVASFDAGIPVQRVLSGKFRRYHHLTKLQHLTIPSVVFPNMRDAILLVFGIMQSIFRLILWRPDVVYANGGYVCLPVGYAAWLLRIPLVIHDADAVAGLTNRLLAPLAAKIGTGLPLEYYDYPRSKATYVSVAISSDFKKVSDEQRKKLKKQLGFDDSRPLVVFTGGGQGARQINDAVLLHYKELVSIANVLLLSGASQYDDVRALTPPDDPR
ncbi:glycosyltransferase, partial [Candidatus Saccharibacteria bacterium]|nr:glycosyltransferase [Candidatus Saccharibacteria bacterium]